ncbi:hypothetical protein [Palleronia pelagia]|uniref:hypothetical protein n=1 Tax=Palleronia pelagia TaxID=387096 RepID=UPI000B884F43|nr:hypothetical protein [Palleronia pelagia]
MSANLTPVEVAKCLLGTIEDVAIAAGFDRKTAFKWVNPSAWRDAGDIPSARSMRRLLDYSDARGLGLTAEHLIRGATRAEVDAILAARQDDAA